MIIPFVKQMRKARDTESASSSLDTLESGAQPEKLLWPALFGAVALPLSFFWFGWSADAHVHWACPVIALGLYSWGNNLLYVRPRFYHVQNFQC